MLKLSGLQRLSTFSLILAFAVVLLGAYTRLSDAGLGCPDWPGCYGQFLAPSNLNQIQQATLAFPDTPVDTYKAWIEMSHRYLAEGLGLVIFTLAIGLYRQATHSYAKALSIGLILIVCAQGLLGMFTVSLKLYPFIVLSHLLGGFATLSLLMLAWLSLRKTNPSFTTQTKKIQNLSVLTLSLLIVQIILGGWTSTNYAALICPDFPLCPGWGSFSTRAFHFFGAEITAPLAYMSSADKITIHMMHRLGAVCLSLMALMLIYSLSTNKNKSLQRFGYGLAGLLACQLSLGISNVVFHLPLTIAVAHNGVAALLLLTLLSLYIKLRQVPYVA